MVNHFRCGLRIRFFVASIIALDRSAGRSTVWREGFSYYGKGNIRVESVPDPEVKDPTDALVRITHACICGSDLWFYRGYEQDWKRGFRTGHEWMGVAAEVGKGVKTVKKGDWVLAPFVFSDGKCEFCEKALSQTASTAG